MNLLEALHPFFDPCATGPGTYGIGPSGPRIIAIVGAGGKTAALFSLAESLAAKGVSVALTTTTQIRDPRYETGRRFDRVVIDGSLMLDGTPIQGAIAGGTGPSAFAGDPFALGGITVVAGATIEGTTIVEGAKLQGIHPEKVRCLAGSFGAVLVEADGAKHLPVKAPAGHEPVVPEAASVVLGIIGLDCLGKPMDRRTVHRPELFGELVGCAEGQMIEVRHLASLARSERGLFKGCPPHAAKVLVFNKADALDREGLESFLERIGEERLEFDRILLCSRVRFPYDRIRELR